MVVFFGSAWILPAADQEQGGLRLEVDATLGDATMITIKGKMTVSDVDMTILHVTAILRNVSDRPITLASRPADAVANSEMGGPFERSVWYVIHRPSFHHVPTVVSPVIYAPVTLLPGECTLLPAYSLTIKLPERRYARTLERILVTYEVEPDFSKLFGWWTGKLSHSFTLRKHLEEDHREWEVKTTFGNPGETNAAAAMRLMLAADRVVVRGDIEEDAAGAVVTDTAWIRQLSLEVGKATLTEPSTCFCSGWRTAFFYRADKLLISVASIHDHQLRVHVDGGGGDFAISEDTRKAIEALLAEKARKNNP